MWPGPCICKCSATHLDEVARHAAVSSLASDVANDVDAVSARLRLGAVTTRLGAERRSRAPGLVCRRGVLGRVAQTSSFPRCSTTACSMGSMRARCSVAAAGTRLLAREESVAAMGNVYTRGDRRGRGTSDAWSRDAVLGELSGVEDGITASTSAPTTMRRCTSTSRSASRATASSTRRLSECPRITVSITAPLSERSSIDGNVPGLRTPSVDRQRVTTG